MAEYIEREALVHHFMTTKHYLTKDLVMDAAYEISKFPAADVVEVKHGRWEQFECGWRDDYWRCSVCDFEFTTLDGEHPQENGVNYCPNCGCRMDGGNE